MSTLKAGFTDLSEKINQIEFPETIKDLLPKIVYTDPKYEIDQIHNDIPPQMIKVDNLISDIGVMNNLTEYVKESFQIFAGFVNAQELYRYGRALEDLKTNPLLSFFDTKQIIEYGNKINLLLEPLSIKISTLRTTNEIGETVAIKDFDTVKDIEKNDEINTMIKEIDTLINKYQDTTIWNTYEAVLYMPIVQGGLAANKFRGSATNPLEYSNIGGEISAFVQLTSPTPSEFNPGLKLDTSSPMKSSP